MATLSPPGGWLPAASPDAPQLSPEDLAKLLGPKPTALVGSAATMDPTLFGSPSQLSGGPAPSPSSDGTLSPDLLAQLTNAASRPSASQQSSGPNTGSPTYDAPLPPDVQAKLLAGIAQEKAADPVATAGAAASAAMPQMQQQHIDALLNSAYGGNTAATGATDPHTGLPFAPQSAPAPVNYPGGMAGAGTPDASGLTPLNSGEWADSLATPKDYGSVGRPQQRIPQSEMDRLAANHDKPEYKQAQADAKAAKGLITQNAQVGALERHGMSPGQAQAIQMLRQMSQGGGMAGADGSPNPALFELAPDMAKGMQQGQQNKIAQQDADNMSEKNYFDQENMRQAQRAATVAAATGDKVMAGQLFDAQRPPLAMPPSMMRRLTGGQAQGGGQMNVGSKAPDANIAQMGNAIGANVNEQLTPDNLNGPNRDATFGNVAMALSPLIDSDPESAKRTIASKAAINEPATRVAMKNLHTLGRKYWFSPGDQSKTAMAQAEAIHKIRTLMGWPDEFSNLKKNDDMADEVSAGGSGMGAM